MFHGQHVDYNKSRFRVFNISGRAYSELVDITRTTVVSDYQPDPEAAYEVCDSNVAKILGNGSVIGWITSPIEGQDGIVLNHHVQELE